VDALRKYPTLLIKNGSKPIDLLSSLAHEAVACPEHNASCDLLTAFCLNEPHLRALHVLAYNMIRVMNMMGIPAMIAAMKA
jgi:hypothetical protein